MATCYLHAAWDPQIQHHPPFISCIGRKVRCLMAVLTHLPPPSHHDDPPSSSTTRVCVLYFFQKQVNHARQIEPALEIRSVFASGHCVVTVGVGAHVTITLCRVRGQLSDTCTQTITPPNLNSSTGFLKMCLITGFTGVPRS